MPLAGPVEGPYGTFYGTTLIGGTNGQGTVYKITPGGPATPLYSFCALSKCADGLEPNSLVWGWDGSLHGTTSSNRNIGSSSGGTIFRLSPSGTLTTQHVFCRQSSCPDGRYPGALIQGADGNFYGVTIDGGTYGFGTVFKIGPGGFETLYSFFSQPKCMDGEVPSALVQGEDGDLYGTTRAGGAGTPCGGVSCGTVFKITTAGVFTTLYSFSFNAGVYMSYPYGLIQGSDGKFYGFAATSGNPNARGAIFSFTPGGVPTLLHVFGYHEGIPNFGSAELVQGTDGAFYGTTNYGGSNNNSGTAFRLDVGLGPFVRPVLTFGKVGARVTILGNDLAGATAVSFNGVPATFKACSTETKIDTTVPAGATTGTITVTTPTGTLTSNAAFTVLP